MAKAQAVAQDELQLSRRPLAGLSLRHGEAVVIVSAASATVCRPRRACGPARRMRSLVHEAVSQTFWRPSARAFAVGSAL